MSDALRLEDILKQPLGDPPRLPNEPFRQRLRGALQTYREKKGKGWTWIYKNEITKKFVDTPENVLSSLGTQPQFIRKLVYWCDENGDVHDEFFIHFITHFLKEYAPECLALCFDAFTGAMEDVGLAEWFSAIGPERRLWRIRREAYLREHNAGKVIEPGTYLLEDRAAATSSIRSYLVVSPTRRENVYRVNLLRIQTKTAGAAPHYRILQRLAGLLLPDAYFPLLFLKSPYPQSRYYRELRNFPVAEINAGKAAVRPEHYVGSLGPIGMTETEMFLHKIDPPQSRLYTHLEIAETISPEISAILSAAVLDI
jgi:hypothetical protein